MYVLIYFDLCLRVNACACVTPLQWFLQQLPEGQRKLIYSDKKEGADGSSGGGVINMAMRHLQEKLAFLKSLVPDIGEKSKSDMQLSIFSFSNKTLHTELLRIIAKFCATTGATPSLIYPRSLVSPSPFFFWLRTSHSLS